MNKTIFEITKMDCPSEENLIRMKLDGISSIANLDFDIPNRKRKRKPKKATLVCTCNQFCFFHYRNDNRNYLKINGTCCRQFGYACRQFRVRN